MAGNLKLGSDYDIIIGRGATRVGGVEYVCQLVKNRILTILGEWQNDKSLGLPWFTSMLSKEARAEDIQAAISNVITSTNHVSQVLYVNVVADYSARLVTISFSALSDFGDISDLVEWKPLPTA